MAVRVLAGFALLPILVAGLIFDPLVAAAVVAVIAAVSVYELLVTTGFVQQKRIVVYAVCVAVLVQVWRFFGSDIDVAAFFLLIYVVLLFSECFVTKNGFTFEAMCGVFFTSIVIPLLFSALIDIMDLYAGRSILLFPFIVAFSSDVFAYFVGTFMGKHKLAPDISPKKTVEGSVGGVIGALIATLLYGLILERFLPYRVNFLLLGVYGMAGAIISQMGDLSMSFVKRQFNIKDFGSFIPGHGGILDRFDSVLFAAPLLGTLWSIAPAIML